jgi:hypothetical protein
LEKSLQSKDKSGGGGSARSKSADLNSARSSSRSPVDKASPRASSAEPNHKKHAEKSRSSAELSRASPTPSILKTSASPRRDSARKQVKFDHNEHDNKKKSKHRHSPSVEKEDDVIKPEMKINWLMTLTYSGHKNEGIKSINTVENYDKGLKNIDNKTISVYNSKMKKFGNTEDQVGRSNRSVEETAASKGKADHLIYVFECNKWLAKDQDDRQIERTIKVNNIIQSK